MVRAAGQLYSVERERRRAGGSAVAFAVNGVAQGVAYANVCGGAAPLRNACPAGGSSRCRADVLFPAASLFTEPTQAEPAAVLFTFGPDFQFPPPEFGAGLPAPQAVAQLCEASAANA